MSDQPAGSSRVRPHPLEPLTEDEIRAAVAAVRATGKLSDAARFASVVLDEPSKEALAALERRRAATSAGPSLGDVPGPDCSVVEALVTVATGDVLSWVERADVRPALLFEESFNAIIALHEHDGFRAAMHKRGITDLDKVQIDPWPTGNFGIAAEEGRRIVRCLFYYREHPTDNGYARPIEGVLATVDMARGEVLDVVDHGVVPIPSEPGSFYPEDNGPLRSDLRPLEIVQPEGTSFSVDGNLIRWQKWSLRVSMDPLEGLVLHTVGYDDDGRTRSILHRASISEMVVPYGDPGPVHGWKNAFDAGDWGLGRMANSLTLGCDCLGEIHYFDAVSANEHGEPSTVANAICLHEEDYGILWKHQDLHGGRTEVRRSASPRRLLDRHGRELRVRLLLVLLPGRVAATRGEAHRHHVDPGVRLRRALALRADDRAGTRRAGPPAPVLRAPRLRRRRPRSTRCTRSTSSRRPPVMPTRGAMRSVPERPGSRRSSVAKRTDECGGEPKLEDRQPRVPQPSRRAGRLQARARGDARRCSPSRTRASGGEPASRPRTSGSLRTPRTSGGPPATIPTSTPVVTDFPGGQRPTGASSEPTSSCGTRSASRMCPGPRTGRSCPSSTAGSSSPRSASSTAIRPWTFRRPPSATDPRAIPGT